MKRNANTIAAEKAAVTEHTTTERKSAERSTSMKRNTTAAKAATATKPITVDVIDKGWKFTRTSIALNGHEFPASKYAITDKGDVYVMAAVEGAGMKLHFGKASPVYHDALEAAVSFRDAQPAKAAEPAKPVEAETAEPAKQAKPATKRKAPAKAAKQPAAKAAVEPAKPVETKAAKPAKQAKPAKAAKQPAAKAAAKPAAQPKAVMPADDSWIGTTIEGRGWRITFDEAAQRTRVIFDADPSAKQKAAIDAAGFYWSATTKSWNKGLKRKAARAAFALADALNAIK